MSECLWEHMGGGVRCVVTCRDHQDCCGKPMTAQEAQAEIERVRGHLTHRDKEIARLEKIVVSRGAAIERLTAALEKIAKAGEGITNVPLEIYQIAAGALAP